MLRRRQSAVEGPRVSSRMIWRNGPPVLRCCVTWEKSRHPGWRQGTQPHQFAHNIAGDNPSHSTVPIGVSLSQLLCNLGKSEEPADHCTWGGGVQWALQTGQLPFSVTRPQITVNNKLFVEFNCTWWNLFHHIIGQRFTWLVCSRSRGSSGWKGEVRHCFSSECSTEPLRRTPAPWFGEVQMCH